MLTDYLQLETFLLIFLGKSSTSAVFSLLLMSMVLASTMARVDLAPVYTVEEVYSPNRYIVVLEVKQIFVLI